MFVSHQRCFTYDLKSSLKVDAYLDSLVTRYPIKLVIVVAIFLKTTVYYGYITPRGIANIKLSSVVRFSRSIECLIVTF